MPTYFKGHVGQVYWDVDKDKEACPKERESNPKDSKGHIEVVVMMGKELQQESQTNEMNHLSGIYCVDHVHQSDPDCCDCEQS